MAQAPTVAQVRAWIGLTPADMTDAQLELILWAEEDTQDAYCDWDDSFLPPGDIPEPLALALLRRVARSVAARGVPLGTLPATSSGMGAEYGIPGGFGAGLLPRWDAEIERLEAPFRVAGIA
jgi:hypothetical protein